MADNAIKGNKQLPTLKILNSFLFLSLSFLNPIIKKGFTNPFLRLLDSFNKNIKVP
jgi:hypothetical protein